MLSEFFLKRKKKRLAIAVNMGQLYLPAVFSTLHTPMHGAMAAGCWGAASCVSQAVHVPGLGLRLDPYAYPKN